MMHAEDLDLATCKERLEGLRLEHRDLNQVIDRLVDERDVDQFHLQRMKKRRLHIKDQIALLEGRVTAEAGA